MKLKTVWVILCYNREFDYLFLRSGLVYPYKEAALDGAKRAENFHSVQEITVEVPE
jgi:hypothetical protein